MTMLFNEVSEDEGVTVSDDSYCKDFSGLDFHEVDNSKTEFYDKGMCYRDSGMIEDDIDDIMREKDNKIHSNDTEVNGNENNENIEHENAIEIEDNGIEADLIPEKIPILDIIRSKHNEIDVKGFGEDDMPSDSKLLIEAVNDSFSGSEGDLFSKPILSTLAELHGYGDICNSFNGNSCEEIDLSLTEDSASLNQTFGSSLITNVLGEYTSQNSNDVPDELSTLFENDLQSAELSDTCDLPNIQDESFSEDNNISANQVTSSSSNNISLFQSILRPSNKSEFDSLENSANTLNLRLEKLLTNHDRLNLSENEPQMAPHSSDVISSLLSPVTSGLYNSPRVPRTYSSLPRPFKVPSPVSLPSASSTPPTSLMCICNPLRNTDCRLRSHQVRMNSSGNHNMKFPMTSSPISNNVVPIMQVAPRVSYTTKVMTYDHQEVTVRLRRPRVIDGLPTNSSKLEYYKSSEFPSVHRKYGHVSHVERLTPTEPNFRDLREKRRVLKSMSFLGPKVSHNEFNGYAPENNMYFHNRPHSSVSQPRIRPSSVSLSELHHNTRAVQSCIISRGTSPVSPRQPEISLETPVSYRKRSSSQEFLSSTRRWSKSLSDKRKAVRSCIFPETVNEDSNPYSPTDFAPLAHNMESPIHKSTSRIPRSVSAIQMSSYSRESPTSPVREADSSSEERPTKSLSSVVRRATSSARKELRRAVRSWSFSPSGIGGLDSPTDSPTSKTTKSPSRRKASRRHTQEIVVIYPPSQDVIFPWRRGDSTRNSGRGSPCPTASYDPAQVQGPHGQDHDDYDANTDPRGKDGVSRRQRGGSGGGGMSRNSRKEKANSSPVFRRASLSHSEWDIRRPWSQVYSERDAAKLSQSVCRLAMAEGGHAEEDYLGEDGDGPKSLPYMSSNAHNSSEGMFQKFKKSLSLRLAKKGSRSDSMGPVSPTPLGPQSPEAAFLEAQTLPRRRGSVSKDSREEDAKPPQSFLFGHPLFRSSKERRRARLKDARSSKCNSGDSGDSGIELVPGVGYTGYGPASDSSHMTSLEMPPDHHQHHHHHHHNHHDHVDSSNYVDPAFVASLAEEGVSCVGVEYNPRLVRRTHSDAGGEREAPRPQAGYPVYQRQLSTPQPIKLRPAHRLPHHSTASLTRKNNMKRSKGSSHLLRRSISQPLDLNKSYDTPLSSFRKCGSPTHDALSRRHRRPSAGNILNEDNTTSDDEYGMSDNEDFKVDLKRSLEEDDDLIVYAEALWDHVTLDAEELVFRAGDLITVIDSSDKDWWWGRIGGKAGWFPAAFVRLLVNQEEHQDSLGVEDSPYSGPSRKLSISGLSHDQIRTNVINEIISTERDFVKHLKDVVEGYLKQIQQRPDMFTQEQINTIFGNMEALYHCQSTFLSELEKCINWDQPHKSCIGECFIKHRGEFEIYSEYCNNHPSASSALQELYQDTKYVQFFEACRLLQEMIDISLDGFLLTPVQKICKYPLQLQELLKYTRPEHPDYISVQGALEAMRDVALLVNERKRRMECLEKIASWQIAVEGWEGQELLDDSSQLIYQGEVTKGAGGSWPKEVALFLFDHQLIYCKRDMLKRNTFVYRGRLNLDKCDIVDLPDGKDPTLNVTVHNAWKIHSLEKNKRYIFSCKSASEKYKWMEAFKRERELVAADEDAGFVVADKAKQLAKIAAKNMKNRPKRPRTTKNHKRVQAMTYAQAELVVNLDYEYRSNSLPSHGVAPPEGGKKKGLWFSFGGQKKGRSRLGASQHHPA